MTWKPITKYELKNWVSSKDCIKLKSGTEVPPPQE